MSTDKSKRKEILKAWKAEQRSAAQATFPESDSVLEAFFNNVEGLVDEQGCFHDTRYAEAAMAELKIQGSRAEALFDWCEDNGGFCDCEIAGNAHQHWVENRSGET
jgi:hypothetical protein